MGYSRDDLTSGDLNDFQLQLTPDKFNCVLQGVLLSEYVLYVEILHPSLYTFM